MFPVFDKTRLQLDDIIKLAAVHMLLQLPPDPVVYWAKARTIGRPGSWSNEVWCFTD